MEIIYNIISALFYEIMIIGFVLGRTEEKYHLRGDGYRWLRQR